MTVGIVGLGLIGGSMAKSIKARTAHTVFGCDLDQETMMMARMCGAIDAPLTAENLKECDLVLVAIRPAAAVKWVKAHAEEIRRDAILVDLCGVKRAVVRELAPVAAHPLDALFAAMAACEPPDARVGGKHSPAAGRHWPTFLRGMRASALILFGTVPPS